MSNKKDDTRCRTIDLRNWEAEAILRRVDKDVLCQAFQIRRAVKPRPCEKLGQMEVMCNGEVHYRRPAGHPMLLEAMNTPGYRVRKVAEGLAEQCPYGAVGQGMLGRETWQAVHFYTDRETGYVDDLSYSTKVPKDNSGRWSPVYHADGTWEESVYERGFPWRSPIMMPAWAVRHVLEISSIQVEYIQDMTEDDAVMCGAIKQPDDCDLCVAGFCSAHQPPMGRFRSWWNQNNKGVFAWDANPPVYVMSCLVLPYSRNKSDREVL